MGKKAECPYCFYEFETEEDTYEECDIIVCPDCGSDLEVAGIDGDTVKLDKLEVGDEDWGE